MNHLSNEEVQILAQIIENFEHPGSPTLDQEFKNIVMAVTSITEPEAEFLFEHMLAIDPLTRKAMHFHHKDFVLRVMAEYEKQQLF